jgi:hypothetical protein
MSTGVVHKQLLITSNLSVNSVHSVYKVVNPHKDYYHYVGVKPCVLQGSESSWTVIHNE